MDDRWKFIIAFGVPAILAVIGVVAGVLLLIEDDSTCFEICDTSPEGSVLEWSVARRHLKTCFCRYLSENNTTYEKTYLFPREGS